MGHPAAATRGQAASTLSSRSGSRRQGRHWQLRDLRQACAPRAPALTVLSDLPVRLGVEQWARGARVQQGDANVGVLQWQGCQLWRSVDEGWRRPAAPACRPQNRRSAPPRLSWAARPPVLTGSHRSDVTCFLLVSRQVYAGRTHGVPQVKQAVLGAHLKAVVPKLAVLPGLQACAQTTDRCVRLGFGPARCGLRPQLQPRHHPAAITPCPAPSPRSAPARTGW